MNSQPVASRLKTLCAYSFLSSRFVLNFAAGLVVAVVSASGLGGSAEAQTLVPVWTQQSPANSPSQRYIHSMTYDASRGQVVLFGGYSSTGIVNDTWLWNGTNWTQANPVNIPPARAAQAMVYDPVHNQTVMFGGLTSASTRLGDTWLWDGSNWTQAVPVNSPSARDGAMMVFDAATSQVLLFGGVDLNGYLQNDTWVWNGSNWVQQVPSTSPSARADGGIAYDAATGQVVLLGGNYSSQYMNDTWLWNGATWTQQLPATSPGVRQAPGMVYDTALGEIVMFGGDNNGTLLSDTWAYNGTTWTQIAATGPSGRDLPEGMVYDPANGQIVLFGGYASNLLNDTWQFGLPGNFGNVNLCPAGQKNVGPCSAGLSFTYSLSTNTPSFSTVVSTQGSSNLDFTVASGNTCQGSAAVAPVCTVVVNFTPKAPGLRMGSIQLQDASGNILVSTPIYGVGQGPAVAIGPGTKATVNTGNYPVNQPKGVATDGAGNLYIADNGNTRVLKVSPAGATTVVGTGLAYPQGMAVDGAGDLFIADNNLNEVVEVPAGCASSSCQIYLGANVRSQLGVAVDGAGNVFFGDFLDGEVIKSPAGCTTSACQTVIYNPAGANPVGLAVDAAGDVFVADYGLRQVVEIPPGCATSACQTTIGQGWAAPESVAVDAAGDVFVADETLYQVIEVPVGCTTATCQVAVAIGVDAYGVAVDAAGDIFFPDLLTNQVYELNRSQSPSLSFAATPVGSTSSDSPQVVTLQNIGNQPLNGGQGGLVTVGGKNFVEAFASTAIGGCAQYSALAPGVLCNLSLSFVPQAVGNPLTSSAVFSDNALNVANAKQTISLSGVGLSAGYTVGGTVTGLSGSGLVLQDNFGDTLPISGSGSFTFPTALTLGSPYSVTVFTQPSGQSCLITGGIGIAQGNVSSVQVTCVNLPYYTLTLAEVGTGSGTVSDTPSLVNCTGAGGATTGICSASYISGSPVTLTANASTGSIFVGWGGACSTSGANPTCALTITSALNVSASFVAAPVSQGGTLKPVTAGVVYGQLGSFSSGASNNGGITASSLGNSQAMLIDGGGNLYLSDGANNRVLFYPAGSTTATRVYGQGGSFTSSNSGVGANSLSNPQGLALDGGGNLYVADQGNNRLLFFPAGSTTATRVYGQPSLTASAQNNGGISASSLYLPIGIALDGSGNLYVADSGNSRVMFYSAGSTTATRVYGQPGFTTNSANNGGISATSLNQAEAVALDSSGDLYVADRYNNRVLLYPYNSTTATVVYGQNGSFTTGYANVGGVSAGSLNNPLALILDSNGGLYVADRSNNRVLYYPFASTIATRVYGQGGSFSGSAANSGGISANSLSSPSALTLDKGGNLYIADYGNNRALAYGSFGNVNVCQGQGSPAPCSSTLTMSYSPAVNTTIGATNVVTQGATGLDFGLGTTNTCTGTIGAGTSCNVNVTFTPLTAGLRQGATDIFDNNGNLVASAPVYGVGQEPVLAFGPGAQSVVNTSGYTLAVPKGIFADGVGNLFLSDQATARVLKFASNGTASTVGYNLLNPLGMAEDGAGNLFIADNTLNQVLELPAGCASASCQAVFLNIKSPSAVAVDGAGDVFVNDLSDGKVIEVPAGCTASSCQTTPYNPGSGSGPNGITVDAAGDLFVANLPLQTVVEVPAGCTATTCQVAIGGGWSSPAGVALDAAGDVYVADSGLREVVQVPPGCQSAGCELVLATNITTQALTVNIAGDILAGDLANGRVIKLTRSQVPALSFAQTNVGGTSVDSPQTILLQNIGNQALTGSFALNLGSSFTQSLAANCPTMLALSPGATCGEAFSFTPQSATFLTGSVVYTDNSLNLAPATQTLSLGGTGAIAGVAGLVAVPNLVGQAQTAAPAPVAAAGLVLGTITSAASSTVPAGSVIDQTPAAGTQVSVGSAVNLLVSTGVAQPPTANPLSLNNNYFVTGDYISAGVTLRGTGVSGMATGTIAIPSYSQSTTGGVPDGADIIDAYLYWETLESTPTASSNSGTFNGYPVVGQQIGNDQPNYVDGKFTGTIRSYRADVNIYLPNAANGIRYATGNYTVSLPDSGGTALPLTEGASLVMIYRVLSPNFPLKSVVLYDGSAFQTNLGAQVMQGFYDAVGGANGTGKTTSLFASGGTWNNSVNSAATLGASSQYSAPLTPTNAYAAVILSTPVNNSDNDGILDAWKTGPAGSDFHAGQPGYYDAKTGTWVGLPGAKHGQKDLFVQLDYMCGNILTTGACDPTQENLFPSPDVNGNDPLAMVQQAFLASGIQLHLTVGNAIPESTCVDNYTTTPAQLCQFPGQPGVIGWKNSLEFSKLYPRNLAACLSGGDCTTRYPFGQKDSYHYVMMGHSLAIPAWNTRYGTLTSISVVKGIATIGTADRGTGINACPSRVTISGVLGDPTLNGVYGNTTCADTKTISFATPGVPNYTYPNNILPEPIIGLTSGTISSISGYSDLGGADSAVTLGLWLTAPNQDMSKRANVLAGTIFHEIGHTLGLGHGGLYYDTPGSYVPTFDANCKPNYQSVMNYLFQLDLLGSNHTLAYSNQTLSSVNENSAGSIISLTDTGGNAATFPTSAWYVPTAPGPTASAATLHCDGTPLAGEVGYRVDSSVSPISPAWTNSQDLSFTGALQTNERGFNDLTNMDLRQVGATGGEFASLAPLLSFGSSVAPLNIGAGGTVTLGSGGTVALGSGGTVTLGSGGTVTLGSGGTIALGSGGTVTLGSGGNLTLPNGGTVGAGSSGTVALPNGGPVTLSSGGTVTLGSGGTVTLGSGGTVTLGSGGTISVGGINLTIPAGGGTVTLGSGGTVTLGSGGTVTLGSGGTVTLGSGGTVALGSGGTVTLGSGGTVTLGSGGTVTLGSGGTVALGSGGTVALGSGGTVTLGSGGTVTLGSGGTVALGSGGTVTLGSGGTTALGSGGTVTLGSGGEATLGAGGTVTLGSGGTVTLGSGGTVTLGSGGTVTLGSGGAPTSVAAGGTVTLGSGGTVTLGSGGTVTLGSGGTVTLGSGGVVTLGTGGFVSLGTGSDPSLGTVNNVTSGSGGPPANELTYETANSVVRPPTSPTESSIPAGVLVTWQAPAFGVVQTYTILRSSNAATPIVIGSVSGVNGSAPATEFLDTNPDLASQTVVYTITTSLVPDMSGASRSSVPSPPAVLKNNQSIVLGPLPSSVTLGNPPIVTATAMSGGSPNGLQVVFTATGSCSIGTQALAANVSSAVVTLAATGSCTVTAAQPGSTAFNAANSVSGTFAVLPAGSGIRSQTINFAALPNVQYGNTFSFSATSTSGMPVAFMASGPCTTGGVINGVGLCKITASVPASGGYSAASLTQSFTVYPAVLKVTANSFTTSYGQAPPALTYAYSGFVNGDTAAVINGAPALSTTATAGSNAGSYPITVATGTLATTNYSFLYVSGTVTVQTANQSALILATTSPLIFNQSQALNLSGGTTGGAITYSLSGLCSISNGRLTANTGTGTCQLSATMAGNSNYNAVTSTPVNVVTLAQASQTINFTTNPPASAVYGSSFTVAATSASGGSIAFTSAGACSNSGATFKMISGTGSCSVTANQAGNTNYAAATPVTKTVTPTLATPSVTFTGAPASAAYHASFPVATTTNASTTAVVTSSGACSNVGATVTMTSGTGACSLKATWAADTNYSGTTATQTTTAILVAQAIAFTTNPPASAAYNSSFTVAATGGASGNALVYTSAGACTNSGATYKMTTGTGACSVIVNQAGNANYSAAPQATKTTGASLAAPTVTFTGAPATALYHSSFTVATTTNAGTAAVITSSGACTSTVSTVTMTSGAGTCLLTATWPANSNFSGTTASQSTLAAPVAQVITFTTNPPATAAYTSTFTVAATGGASANPVVFTSMGACTNSGVTFTLTNSTGACSVIANQAGNANYSAAPTVTRSVTANGPLLSVSPASVDFGTVYQGSINIKTITLTSIGTAPVTINDPILSLVKGGNSNEFLALSLCPRSLAVGRSCTVTIAFIAGPFYTPQTAALQIMSNAPGSPQPVALTATVINPQAFVNASSLRFGTVKHGTNSTVNVTLSNPGTTPLTLSSIGVTGSNTNAFAETNSCGSSLAAGASCSIAVKFTPPATGSFNANLTIVDNAQSCGGAQSISLSGTGN